MIKATLTTQVTVETPNTVGIAAKVTQLVAQKAKVNIKAAWAAGENGKGHFALITDSNQKVVEALKNDFPKTQEREVIVFKVENAVGEIAEVTNKISAAGIGIDYLFTTYFEDKPAIVVATNDNKKAYELFSH